MDQDAPLGHGGIFGDCPDCNGTGRNLAGVLPGLEWSAQDVRKATDGAGTHGRGVPPWQADVYAAGERRMRACTRMVNGANVLDGRTRTVPRGEHRDIVNARDWEGLDRRGFSIDGCWPFDIARWVRIGEPIPYTLDQRINWRGRGRPGPMCSWMPRWRRGELRHAEQRRAANS